MRKKVLALVLALVMVIAMLPTVAFAADFADTKGHWAETQIDRWSDFGVVGGDGTGFNPNGSMTRAQAAQVFVNLLKLTKAGDITAYTDVPATAWYADAISKVVEKGIMNGVSATTMNPEGTLTREQMFVMIGRALGVKPVETATKTFVDGKETSDWATGYINALADMGVIHGTGNNELNPTGVINRASVMTVLDNLIGGYANEDGQTVEIQEGKITLIVADDVKVTGEADPDMPIVVAGAAKTVDLEGVTVTGEEAPVVQVQVEEVAIENAPEGTTVAAPAEATDVKVNGETVEAGSTTTAPAPEPEQTAPSQQGTTPAPAPQPAPSEPTPSADPDEGKALEVANKAWDALAELLTTKGVNSLIIAEKDTEGHYTLTLDADAIKADNEAITDANLNGLMTAIKKAIDDNFGTATLNIKVDDGAAAPVPVYANKAFNNTNLKAALVYVADGFFWNLSKLDVAQGTAADSTYEYKTLTGTVVYGDEADTAEVSLAIQLKGEDVKKVQALAAKLEKYLSMETMSADEIASKYGTISGLSGESEYIVVGVEMPESVMTKLTSVLQQEETFKGKKVSEMFNYLKAVEIGDVLSNDKDNLNSLFTTVNSNANLINKVLGKMTITINGKSVTTNFDPSQGDTAWKKFIGGVGNMFSSGDGTVGETTVGSYAVTGGTLNGQGYYAVPVKVTVDLPSMDFNATETILVVLHIPYSAD